MTAPTRRELLAGLALGALAGPGCTRQAHHTVLSVATFPDLDRAARIAKPVFEARHPGLEVRIASLAYSDFPTAMITALAAGANLPDLMAMDREIVGRLAESAGLEDLRAAPYHADRVAGQLPAFALAAAHSSRGTLAALPVDVGPGALFYRADLLQRAGLAEAELTRSWDDYVAAGRRLRERTGAYLLANAGDIKDIHVRAALRDGEGVHFDSQGRVLVESPRFQRGFALARAARRAGIDARTAAWSNEWAEGFRRGRVASQMMGAWLGGHLKNWIVPQQAGLWRSAPLPEGEFASWGGSYYAIPRQAPNKALAWEFLQLLALDRGQQLAAFRGLDAFPALLAAHDDPFMAEPLPFFGGQRARQQWRDAVARIPAVDADRYDAVANDMVNAQLEKVLEHDKPIPAALADAAAAIERRVRRH